MNHEEMRIIISLAETAMKSGDLDTAYLCYNTLFEEYTENEHKIESEPEVFQLVALECAHLGFMLGIRDNEQTMFVESSLLIDELLAVSKIGDQIERKNYLSTFEKELREVGPEKWLQNEYSSRQPKFFKKLIAPFYKLFS